jgi:23S rRNA (guanosine2251-2'-O)-methyltransferase
MRIYGFHAVLARLRHSPESIKELYVDQDRDDPRMRELVKLATDLGVRAMSADANRLDRLCPKRRHQGVVAIVEAAVPTLTLEDLLAGIDGPALLLVLDGVTDPRNLGACLRVADGAGCHGVIAPKDHSCLLTEVAIQTASGAAESVPYVMVTNLARALDTLQENRVWTVGAADEATESIYEIEVPQSVAWVLGAEGTGLRRLTRDRCDLLASIPMAGQVSSLNVSVAAGIVLYETVRQRAAAASQDS